MRETLDRVTFAVANPSGAAELAAFHEAHGHALEHSIGGQLVADKSPDEPEFPIHLRTVGTAILAKATVSYEHPDLEQIGAPLAEERPLLEWVKLATSNSTFSVRIDATYDKRQELSSGHFRVYSPEGLEALLPALVAAKPPLTVETDLVPRAALGRGIALKPSGATVVVPPSPSDLIVAPQFPPLKDWLASLQLLVLKARSGLETKPPFKPSLAQLDELALWLSDHNFRHTIAKSYLEKQEPISSEKELQDVTRVLPKLEDDLTKERVSSFLQARDALGDVAVEPIRAMHDLRMGLVAAVGNEIFQTAVSIALVLGGFKLADFKDTDTMTAVSFAIATLFSIGFVLRAITQNSVFRDTLAMNRTIEPLPLSKAIPGFREWYANSIDSSITSFYRVLGLGTPVAFAPLIAVGCFWLSHKGHIQNPIGLFFAILSFSLVTGTLVAARLARKARTA